MIEQLTAEGIKHVIGPVWITDRVYREKHSKVLKFRNQGVMTVNMETSALFAVAEYHNMEIASSQVVSDIISESGWLPAFRQQEVQQSLQTLLGIIIKVLSKIDT